MLSYPSVSHSVWQPLTDRQKLSIINRDVVIVSYPSVSHSVWQPLTDTQKLSIINTDVVIVSYPSVSHSGRWERTQTSLYLSLNTAVPTSVPLIFKQRPPMFYADTHSEYFWTFLNISCDYKVLLKPLYFRSKFPEGDFRFRLPHPETKVGKIKLYFIFIIFLGLSPWSGRPRAPAPIRQD